MTHFKLKMLLGGLALSVAVGLLAVAGVREGWVYYLPVDRFVDDAEYHDQRVRLHGAVSAAQLEIDRTLLRADFGLVGDTHEVRVAYRGVIPDMFKAERDVVVEGRLGDDGIFHADTLLTKCASKYESGEGEAPHSNPGEPEPTS